ncbi:MAG: ATP-binding protein [Desulfobacterales bacterium]|nr:ATP-binding protein [Desulfobacterales bacterium]
MRKENEPQGGKLTVSLKKIFADKDFCIAHPEAHEMEYWALTVQDTGVGMDTKTVAKIFDPFFTTKQKDKGTGLGLAMVYNIVQQHGGFIDVYSVMGLGSTFNIYLPALQGAESAVSTEKPFVIPRGEGLILVVDDEEIIRQTARAILEECGSRCYPCRKR